MIDRSGHILVSNQIKYALVSIIHFAFRERGSSTQGIQIAVTKKSTCKLVIQNFFHSYIQSKKVLSFSVKSVE